MSDWHEDTRRANESNQRRSDEERLHRQYEADQIKQAQQQILYEAEIRAKQAWEQSRRDAEARVQQVAGGYRVEPIGPANPAPGYQVDYRDQPYYQPSTPDTRYEQGYQAQYQQERLRADLEAQQRVEDRQRDDRIHQDRLSAIRQANKEADERLYEQMLRDREDTARRIESLRQDQERLETAHGDRLLADLRDNDRRDAERLADQRDAARQDAIRMDNLGAQERDRTTRQDADRAAALAAAQATVQAPNFAASPVLGTLWSEASRNGTVSVATARENFWSRVNNSADAYAEYLRNSLKLANYTIREDSHPPLLNIETGAKNPNLDKADRILELEHRAAIANLDATEQGRRVAAENLRYMQGRDNRFRGWWWTEDDRHT
ncbi:hypothetical protein [Actinoplanes sp. M2I2]|uniref:hypothetical protein n=1 Tax=Actinoplanes sp. M2I2 TaxID=1734444 RepID=UPI002021A68C|nr:hypothetical protein [Actinoplanes sp. M2I2]